MSVPIPPIGKATKLRQLCQPIRTKTYSSLREMTGQNQPQLPETVPYSQQRRKYSRIGTSVTRKVLIRINQFTIELTRINGFWLKKMCFWTYLTWILKSTILKKGSIIWKNEHDFSIICPPKEQSYWHIMLLFLAQSIKAYFRGPKNSKSSGGACPRTSLSSLLLRPSLLPTPINLTFPALHWLRSRNNTG